MADFCDKATETETREREAILAAHTHREARIAESMRSYDPSAPRDCADCEAPIEPARLRAVPHTGRCASCAREAEERLRRGVL